MATRNAQVDYLPNGDVVVTWAGLLNGDDGSPVSLPGRALATVQITGTVGVGFAGTLNCSAEEPPVNYGGLQTLPTVTTSIAIATGPRASRYYRPAITAGDGTTNVAVLAYYQRGKNT